MNLRRSLLGLLTVAMFAVMFSSFGVVSAAASTTEECKIPTEEEEFTSRHFSDENCEKESGAEGKYHTTLIPGDSILRTTKTSPIVLRAEKLAKPLEIACEEYGGTKTVSNYKEEEKRGFKGEGSIELSGCVVQEPTVRRTVSSTIDTVQLELASEDLKEVQRTLFVPKEGTKIASFTIEGGECPVAGSYTIEGKLRSQTVTIHTEEFGAKTGSEMFISKEIPIYWEWIYHEVTKANGKQIVRELP